MPPKATCPPPPVPPNPPSDWKHAVDGNCFSNIQRLGQWTGGTTLVPSGTNPAPYFKAVTAGSLGGGASPPPIYVVAHGWAPGYRAAVKATGGKIVWWGPNASVNNVWASDWAWSPVTVPLSPAFPVNPTGLLQSIVALHPTAIVLAWSWIDNSATDSGDLKLDEVYRSEAYTHFNGVRLANALEQAIAPSFWSTYSPKLRLIGHSHGSKVATVAALTLQQMGRRVGHLTILDAPDCEVTLEANGGNLLGFYLEQMQIVHPFYKCASGAFVDNYASYFGVGYDGATNLKNMIEVALTPSELYWTDNPSAKHTYAAAWYGGAAAGAVSQKEAPLGLAWPPPPQTYLPALKQTWPTGMNQFSQWQLALGTMPDIYSYETTPLAIATVGTQGNVRGDPSSMLSFGLAPGPWPAYSIFQGSYNNSPESDNYGIAFDLQWSKPLTGEYFVITMESPEKGEQEVLLVLDGQSFPDGKTSIAINCDKSSYVFSLSICIYFLAAKDNHIGQVDLSNFRFVVARSDSGYLRARRLASAAEKLAKRSLEAPRVARGTTPEIVAPLRNRSRNEPSRPARGRDAR